MKVGDTPRHPRPPDCSHSGLKEHQDTARRRDELLGAEHTGCSATIGVLMRSC